MSKYWDYVRDKLNGIEPIGNRLNLWSKPVVAESNDMSDDEVEAIALCSSPEAMKGLNRTEQEVFQLHVIRGIPIESIETVLGIGRSKIYRTLAKISKKLKYYIKQNGR